MQPQQAFMMCLPQPQMTQQRSAAADEEAKMEAVPGYRRGMETKVTTAGIPISRMPKCRMTEAIEFVDSRLDVTVTATLEPNLLIIIMWEQTGLRPGLKLNDLRCKSYLDLYMRMRSASERLKTQPAKAQLYQEYVDHIRSPQESSALEDYIMVHGVRSGFNPEWMEKQEEEGQ